MSWCKELVMAENRALFEIVDPTTGQISDDRALREKVFRQHFEGISTEVQSLDQQNIRISSLNVNYLKSASEIFLEMSDFADKQAVYAFNLNEIFKEPFDSLFVYTNINEHKSFLLCTDFTEISAGEYECANYNDLFTSSHTEIDTKSIPPYFEGYHREASLKTINIVDLKKLVNQEKYSFLIVKAPSMAKNKLGYQLMLKFDWYMLSERVTSVDLPTLTELSKFIQVSPKSVFQRIYLPQLVNVLQAYTLYKVPAAPMSCDDFLTKKVEQSSQNNKPMSTSSAMIQFYEPLLQAKVMQTIN